MKSTVEEIQQRFDADVERFSNLETGQSATVDAPLAMALVAEAAAATSPHARHVLDVGCGAGNYTLKLLEFLPNLDATRMARSRNTIPTYRKHGKTGRAVISVYRADGSRTEILLPGPFGSKESKAEYERILAQLRAGNGKLPANGPSADLTIAELVQRYMAEHAEPHFRRQDGTPTGELTNIVFTVRPLVRLFGSKLASEFTPNDLKVYREALITASWLTPDEKKKREHARGKGTVCRKTTNQRVSRIKGVFKWAASGMLIPASVWHACQTVTGLQAGRGKARESKPVDPVPLEDVESTLEFMPEAHAAIIRLQLYSGARITEILSMRAVDIDQTGGDVWTYRPTTHKNQWRGHDRQIVFGPKSQLILRRYLRPDSPEAFLFVPGMGRQEAVKTTKRERYFVTDIDKSIGRACKRAKVPHWSSHQLRHLAAQLAESEMSLEGARAYLGQKTVNMTAHYSGLNVKTAAEVARKLG